MYRLAPSTLLRILSTVVVSFLVFACGGNDATTLRIAEQHGLAYAPLALIQSDGTLDEAYDVTWVRVNNAAAIREAMLAGRLDIGFMGIPPYLIGRDNDTDWTVFTGLSRAPLGLVTIDREIPDFATLAASDTPYRIALPQPGSIQHILLAMALDRRYGEPARLDERLVSLGHPDGMNALLAGEGGEIAAHFTSPPFIFEELRHPDARLLLSGEEAFGGPFTFIIGATAPGIGADDERVDTFRRALDAAIARLSALQRAATASAESAANGDTVIVSPADLDAEHSATLTTLAAFYGVDEARLLRDLSEDGVVFEREIRGLDTFRSRMRDYGYLDGDGAR